MARRIKLGRPSEKMRQVFALIADEVSAWPDVSTKPMFGLRAMYRDGIIFAMLPDKRSLEDPNSVAYRMRGKWVSLEIKDQDAIAGALGGLTRAYEEVKAPAPSSR